MSAKPPPEWMAPAGHGVSAGHAPPAGGSAGHVVSAGRLIGTVAGRLTRGDTPARRLDARLILGLAMGREDAVLPHEDIVIESPARAALDALIRRRNKGEPVSRLRGWREFYGLKFILNAATLDPRPDSEIVVDTALALARDMARGGLKAPRGGIQIADFGTGSGCLLLALLHSLGTTSGLGVANGLGVDISPEAIAAGRGNAQNLGLDGVSRWQVSDWDEGLGAEAFDLIISNPPYIARPQIAALEPEVREHDPRAALDGGGDGLAAWRALLPVIARRLTPQGRAVVEIGHGQAEDVRILGVGAGLQMLGQKHDLGGRVRCLILGMRG